MKRHLALIPFCIALVASLPPHAAAETLEPTDEMAAQTRWVVNTINARHYLRETVGKLDGKEMVEAYVESFDYGKMYFRREEVDEFVFRFADAMEQFLDKGNLYAAFEIYRVYKEKASQRVDWIRNRLEQDFDFGIDETFAPDRRERDWPASKERADALWERRLKYELLNEMLSLAGEDEEDSVSLEPDNPDIMDTEAAPFDPSKIRRLLRDEAFFAETLAEAKDTVLERYNRNLGYTLDREAAEVQESFINAMTGLFDPHSSFLSADTLESFNSSVQNSFVGIGALLQDEDGICTIKEILPGGPAEESGLLEPEDQILGVAQGKDGAFEDVVDMQLRYIVRKIKGEEGTTVRLLIRPGDAADPSVRKEISIVRGEVKLTANLASARLISVPTVEGTTIPVGVIELPSFYGNIGAGGTLTTTSDDVSELLDKLKEAGAEGLILDLRMNGGGLLSEAVRLTGLFIPTGPVVQVRDSEGRTDLLADRNPTVAWSGPLVVLTSRFSASASEIVAGALRDHGRALIVGNSSTHGKGTVQEVYHMANRRAFSLFQKKTSNETRPVASKITIKQFYLPGGSSTQLKGVPSDIALPSVNEFLPIGEDDLPHALPWNKIDAVDWEKDSALFQLGDTGVDRLKARLQARSEARQNSLEEFKFLKRQIKWRRKRFEEKEISLHLEKRINKKIQEQSYIETLDETHEALSSEDYEMREFILEVTKEQEALSRKNQEGAPKSDGEGHTGSNEAGATDDDENEEDDRPFDIYLRESARIMADWVRLSEKRQHTAKVGRKADSEPRRR